MTNEYDEEHDAPKEIPNEITEEVRDMTPSFKMVDINKYFDLIKYKPYGKQWLYHKSKTRFKIVNAGRRAGKTMMVGKNVQPLLLVPNKRVWAVGPSYCTDKDTEILTRRGWLRYDEIIEGDETLTLNSSGLAEWQNIDSVHIFDGQHDMISMEWRGHSSLTTPNHRWLVGYTSRNTPSGQARTLGFRFTTTENLKKLNEYVLCATPTINLPTEQKYSDAFVELVAWYWTEGCDQAQGNGIIITQNRGPNSNRIAAALTSLFGPASDSHVMRNRYDTKPRWSDWKTIDGLNRCGNFGLNSHAGVLFREVAPDKIVSSEFIASLTKSQLELFINISVMADGHSRERDGFRGRERGVVQKRKDRLDPLQMACQLAGYQTNLNYQQARDDYWLSIFERNKIWPGGKTQKLKHKNVKYNGIVWCPKTANGTWLARRNGTVYFTGNTLGEKEFRVVWDDMIVRLGFGKDKRVKKAYNIKQGNMFIELPWNTRFEVRSAERPDYLVGDSLDHVIMSEAAIHNSETWYRYVQPALSDKRGTADFPSTPRGMNWYHKLWQYGQNPDYLEFESWQYPSWANQIIYPGGRQDPEILLLERTLPHDEFLQEIAADFTSFAGKIYSEFDETIHVRKCEYNPAWRNYMCVDEETEILTSNGWKRHNELNIGDSVLSINEKTGLSEWDEVLTINKYEGIHDVMRMEGRSHSSVTTLNHRWLVNRSYVRNRGEKLGWRWTTTDKLSQNDRIPTAAPCINLPTTQKYSDAFVELIAWLWTEGSVDHRYGQKFAIHQSHKVNPNNVARIRMALSVVADSNEWKENIWPSNPNITTFTLSRKLSAELWVALSAHKMVKPEFISELTKSQLNLFLDVSILADGYQRGNRRTVCQENPEQLAALQMACSLLGITTNLTKSNGYTLHINNRSFVNPGMAKRHLDGKFIYEREKYEGVVWCPMTKNGTWLARRRGTVYFTGNCFDFGYVNPLAAIEFQIDPMDRVHVWREHYKDRIILEDHLDILRNRVQPPGYKIDLCFGDAADPGAIETISSYFAPCWGDPKSKDDWMEGVRLVKSFLKQQEVGVLDEYGTPKLEPWLFVDHSCENTIREFNNYRSAPKASNRNETNLRETAQKYDDHALDALRYGLMHVFKLGANVSIQSVVGRGDLKKVEDGGFFKNSSLFKTVGGLFDNSKRF